MKKILIMVMSCCQETYINQEKIIKETWLSDVVDNKYENIDYCFYKGSVIPKHKYIKETHELILRCEDDLNNTYKKTYYSLKIIDKIFKDYDYIVRTNTSTYINIPVLNAFIQSLDRDDILYGSDLYSLSEACCPYPLNIYSRGNLIIMSRNIVENIILKYGLPLLYSNITDDISIGNIFNSYWISKNENYLDHIKCVKHRWYKSVDLDNIREEDYDNKHQLSSFVDKKTNIENCYDFITTQIKIYAVNNKHYDANKIRFEDIEKINYFEYDKEFKKINFTNDLLEKAVQNNKEYSENPSIFIGSIIGYINLDEWKAMDKMKLYQIETNNKASDDAQLANKGKLWL